MRASTLFALSLALLIGLGVAVGVKVSGVLNPPPPPPKADTPPPPTPPSILVAARNLHPGDYVSQADVRVRYLTNADLAEYKANYAKYLPPIPEAAHYRLVRKNIQADQPLTQDLLDTVGKPEPLHTRLLPLTRAVDVQVPRESSAAGLIQVGDWVDVYITSEVGRTDDLNVSARTALLARAVQVVAKGGTLYQIYAPLPPGPIPFTLAANPYRAALIDYARKKGTLSLMPVSGSEKARLDAMKPEIEKESEKIVTLGLPVGSEEAKAELARVLAYYHGQVVAGDEDLARVFGLKPLASPEPPLAVEYFRGLHRQGSDAFAACCGNVPSRATAPPKPLASYSFQQPKEKEAPKTAP